MFLEQDQEIELRQVEADETGISTLLCRSRDLMASLYPAASNHSLANDQLLSSSCHLVAAYIGGSPVGCGAVIISGDGDYGEIKSLYVSKSHRRRGIAGKIMKALESHIATYNISVARLETGIRQSEALGLYRDLGYVERGPFGKYLADPNSIFMEKHIDTSTM